MIICREWTKTCKRIVTSFRSQIWNHTFLLILLSNLLQIHLVHIQQDGSVVADSPLPPNLVTAVASYPDLGTNLRIVGATQSRSSASNVLSSSETELFILKGANLMVHILYVVTFSFFFMYFLQKTTFSEFLQGLCTVMLKTKALVSFVWAASPPTRRLHKVRDANVGSLSWQWSDTNSTA